MLAHSHLWWRFFTLNQKISLSCIIFILILISCGGGGGEYFPPRIAVDEIGIKKEAIDPLMVKEKHILEVSLDRKDEIDKYIGGIQYYHFANFQYNSHEYLIGIPLDNYVSIFDSEEKFIKKLNTPRYSTKAKALELVGKENRKYLAVFIDPTRKKPGKVDTGHAEGCDHKHVIAYTVFRTVRCTTCGALLDPFGVLVDMLKGYVPPNAEDREEKRMDKEVKKRSKKNGEEETSNSD